LEKLEKQEAMARILAFINPRLSSANVGDVFIEDSVKHILTYDRAASFDIDPRKPILPADIERINSAHAAVIVGTNLWYRSVAKPGRWEFSASDLKKIRVPIVPFGVGTTRHFGEDNGFDRDTRKQLKIIHSSCQFGSVRDIRTAEALREAGIANVSVTGCPTMFRSLAPEWKLRRKPQAATMALTVRKGQEPNVRLLMKLLRRRGLEPIVPVQRPSDRSLCRWVPFVQRATPLIHGWDIAEYLKLVEQCSGAIGWRLHGNMLHLAHGNPAISFANCSRTASFCELFELPTLRNSDGGVLSESAISRMLDHFFDDRTFANLPRRYREVRAEMIHFLDANGLDHNLSQPAQSSAAA
jgi:polysaccharide pyruvyl transferase WcaK-like protein